MRLTRPGRLKFRTESGDQQDWQAVDPRENEVEELPRSGIDPMQILEDHQYRLRSGDPFELPQQRRESALLLALWAQLEWRETVAAGQGQQLHQQRDVAGRGRRCEQRRQLVEFCLGPVVPDEPGAAFELGDERIERAVLMMRRAEIAQAGVGLGSDVLGKCRREPRLADARLARDQHHPSFAALSLLPAADKQLDFLVAPDEWRLPRAQSLELAQHPAIANDP